MLDGAPLRFRQDRSDFEDLRAEMRRRGCAATFAANRVWLRAWPCRHLAAHLDEALASAEAARIRSSWFDLGEPNCRQLLEGRCVCRCCRSLCCCCLRCSCCCYWLRIGGCYYKRSPCCILQLRMPSVNSDSYICRVVHICCVLCRCCCDRCLYNGAVTCALLDVTANELVLLIA